MEGDVGVGFNSRVLISDGVGSLKRAGKVVGG